MLLVIRDNDDMYLMGGGINCSPNTGSKLIYTANAQTLASTGFIPMTEPSKQCEKTLDFFLSSNGTIYSLQICTAALAHQVFFPATVLGFFAWVAGT